MIKIKRIYDAPAADDGLRVLVDRLWPRGLSKAKAAVDLWLKEIAPSSELRTWYAHKPERWEEFKRRYYAELEGKQALLDRILGEGKKKTVTLLYSSKERNLNNAQALLDFARASHGPRQVQ